MTDGRLNILLVEDNPADARLVFEMLRERPDHVNRIAHAGRLGDALELLPGAPFDVVLLDVNLPDSGGLNGLKTICARHPEVPTILLTGIDDEALAVLAMQHSAGDYLVKGQISASLLLRSMRYAIERKQAAEILRRDKETFERLVRQRSQELLDAQRELEKAKRLSDIGTLAAIVAHELRNPLAAMAMAAFNIRRKAACPGLDRHLQNIEKKIGESNQIISNLLFYTRLKPPQYAPVELRGVIEECLNTSQSMASRSVPVTIELPLPEEIVIEADAVQIKEVFSNMLCNAFDAVAGDPLGKVSIRTEQQDAFVSVAVSDTGPGIEKQLLEKIFEPFFTTKAKGTGLGLYVCRQIADLHGGAISVDSAPGRGTAVRVTLPRKQKAAAKAGRKEKSGTAYGKDQERES